MTAIHDTFRQAALAAPWQALELGGGQVTTGPDGLRLHLPAQSGEGYANAQIDDYAGLSRRDFPWQPPLRMTVRAAAATEGQALAGTAGFGFWNAPFLPGRREIPRLPRAVWFFFGGPRNKLRLALDQPGHGWKAATFDAQQPLFYGLLPLALPGLLLMRLPALYRALWPLGQRALGVAEAHLADDLLRDMHTYTIEWRADGVRCAVDDRTVLDTPRSPRGPLGFVAWIDNQYAVVTPQGQFGHGVTACAAQTLHLDRLTIEPLTP